MAENVQSSLELCAKEFAELKEDGTFNEKEISKLLKKLRQLENNLAGGQQLLDNYEKIIDFEKNVIAVIRIRKGKKRCEWFFINRVVHYYEKAILLCPRNYDFHLNYYQFLKLFPEQEQATTMLINKMIKTFISEPKVFSLAATWYQSINKPDEAKKILHSGQSRHPENLDIYLDLLELEIKKGEANLQKRLTKYIEFIVEKKVPRKFLEETILLFEKKSDINNMDKLLEYGLSKLMEVYKDEVETYSFVANFHLKANPDPSIVKGKYAISSIEKAITKFREGIKRVPEGKKSEIWKNYLDFVIEMYNEHPANNELKLLLKSVLQEARELNINFTVEQFIEWAELSNDNLYEMIKKLAEGITHYPTSELLWGLYLKSLVLIDEEDMAHEQLFIATKKLGEKAVIVWDIYIGAMMATNRTQDQLDLEKEFKHVFELEPPPHEALLRHLKVRYYSMVALVKDIEKARQVYDRLASTPPFSQELHQEAYFMERLSDTSSAARKKILKILNLWNEQFGDTDPIVHQYLVTLAKEAAPEPPNVREVYEKALTKLKDPVTIRDFKLWYSNFTEDTARRDLKNEDTSEDETTK